MNSTLIASDDKPDYGIPLHPLCQLFPLMDKDSLAGLIADIQRNGLLNPIIVHEGQVVDGRNRLLACQEAGVAPRYLEWSEVYQGPMSLVHWIWSVNGERRHLTVDQITAAQVAIKAWKEQEAARQRQIEAGKQFHKGRRKVVDVRAQSLPEAAGRVREKLAQEIGVSQRKVGQALAVHKADPELLKRVARGEIPLHQAAQQVAVATAATPPAPGKRRQILDHAAKKRMISGLTSVHGICQCWPELDISAVRRASTAEELETWASIAHHSAKELRALASKLRKTGGNNAQATVDQDCAQAGV